MKKFCIAKKMSFLTSCAFLLILFLVGSYLLIPPLFFVDELFTNDDSFRSFMQSIDWRYKANAQAPAATWNTSEGGRYLYGRYHTPLPNMNTHDINPLQRLLQLKTWCWTSAVTSTKLFGMAIMSFHYVAHVVFYSYDVTTNTSLQQMSEVPGAVLFPGTALFSEGPGEDKGCTTWSLKHKMRLCYDAQKNEFSADLQAVFPGSVPANVSFAFSMSGDVLSVVYPLGPRRPTMTTKAVAKKVFRALSFPGWNEKTALEEPIYGMLDYSRTLGKRLTVWKWFAASFTDVASSGAQTPCGLQLTAEYYVDASGASLESFVSVNGVVTPISCPVIYREDDGGNRGKWTITAPCVGLTVTFLRGGQIPGNVNYGIIQASLYHMWGKAKIEFTVVGTTYRTESVPAVLEDHHSLW